MFCAAALQSVSSTIEMVEAEPLARVSLLTVLCHLLEQGPPWRASPGMGGQCLSAHNQVSGTGPKSQPIKGLKHPGSVKLWESDLTCSWRSGVEHQV